MHVYFQEKEISLQNSPNDTKFWNRIVNVIPPKTKVASFEVKNLYQNVKWSQFDTKNNETTVDNTWFQPSSELLYILYKIGNNNHFLQMSSQSILQFSFEVQILDLNEFLGLPSSLTQETKFPLVQSFRKNEKPDTTKLDEFLNNHSFWKVNKDQLKTQFQRWMYRFCR